MTTNKVSAIASACPENGVQRVRDDRVPPGATKAEFLSYDLRFLSNAAYLAAMGIRHIAEDSEISVEDARSLAELTHLVSDKAYELHRTLYGEDA